MINGMTGIQWWRVAHTEREWLRVAAGVAQVTRESANSSGNGRASQVVGIAAQEERDIGDR